MCNYCHFFVPSAVLLFLPNATHSFGFQVKGDAEKFYFREVAGIASRESPIMRILYGHFTWENITRILQSTNIAIKADVVPFLLFSQYFSP